MENAKISTKDASGAALAFKKAQELFEQLAAGKSVKTDNIKAAKVLSTIFKRMAEIAKEEAEK